MSTDTKWIVGTGIGVVAAILTTGVGLAALMVSLISGVNTRIDDVNVRIGDLDTSMNARIDDLRTDLRDFRTEVTTRMDGFDTRLRNVEIAFGKVDQRLLIIERFALPTPEQPAE